MKKMLKGMVFYVLMLAIIVGVIQFTGKEVEEVKEIPFSKVYQELNEGDIASIYFVDDTSVEGVLKDKTKFKSYIPSEVKSEQFADKGFRTVKTE